MKRKVSCRLEDSRQGSEATFDYTSYHLAHVRFVVHHAMPWATRVGEIDRWHRESRRSSWWRSVSFGRLCTVLGQNYAVRSQASKAVACGIGRRLWQEGSRIRAQIHPKLGVHCTFTI